MTELAAARADEHLADIDRAGHPTGRRAAVVAWTSELATLARASFARHRWFVAIVGVYFIGAVFEWRFAGSVGASFRLYTMTCVGTMAAMLVAILMIHAVYVMVAIRPARLFRELGRQYRSSLFRADRIANGLPVLVLLPVFFNSFTVLKTSAPHIAPFAWDAAVAKADLWLQGGIAPWTLLQPWFASHLQAPHFVDLAYVWFFMLWLVVVWQIWTYYTGREIGFGGGISAMPSMHVAMAFLLMLMASRLHRGLGLGAFLYYLIIQIGSVQLGWHYAIDGYASAIATAILWWAAGRALDRHGAAADRAARGDPPCSRLSIGSSATTTTRAPSNTA